VANPAEGGVLESGCGLEAPLVSFATYAPARALASQDLDDSPLTLSEFVGQFGRALARHLTG